MPQLVSFIVWHLLRDYSPDATEALARARFGAIPPAVWAEAMAAAGQALNTTALFLGAPMDARLIDLLPGTTDLTQPVTMAALVSFGKGGGPLRTVLLTFQVDAGLTVGQVYADMLTRAAALAAQSDAYVDAMEVVPPIVT